MSELEHPNHGDLVRTELNTRVHDGEEKIKCERCGFLVDELRDLDDVDCDHYKNVREGVTDGINRL